MNNLSERIAERLRDRAYSSKFPDPLLEAAANEIDRLRHGAVRGCETVQSATNHDVAPAAIAVSDEDRTDKADTSHRDDGTGDTQGPVAWVAFATDGSESSAFYMMQEQSKAAADDWGWGIAPLYRSPTLTDAEREAVCEAVASYEFDDYDEECVAIAATLRGLLDRTGSTNPERPPDGL